MLLVQGTLPRIAEPKDGVKASAGPAIAAMIATPGWAKARSGAGIGCAALLAILGTDGFELRRDRRSWGCYFAQRPRAPVSSLHRSPTYIGPSLGW